MEIMAIGGISPFGGQYGAAAPGGYDNGAGYNQLANAHNNANAAADRAAQTGSPQDAQAAKQASNKETEAAQAAATKESARSESVKTLLR
jgi:hypothetical protein